MTRCPWSWNLHWLYTLGLYICGANGTADIIIISALVVGLANGTCTRHYEIRWVG